MRPDVAEQLEIEARYRGYLDRQAADIAAFRREEGMELPADLDFARMGGLSRRVAGGSGAGPPDQLGRGGPDPWHDARGPHPALPACPPRRMSPVTPLTRSEAALLDVSRETLDRCEVYLDLLGRWQRPINLVGATTLADPWRRHILDCGQLWRHWPSDARRLVDLGSGAGLPGLILALLGRTGGLIWWRATSARPPFFARRPALRGHGRRCTPNEARPSPGWPRMS